MTNFRGDFPAWPGDYNVRQMFTPPQAGPVPQSPTQQITHLLDEVDRGHGSAAEQLLPLVYDQLRALASSFFRRQRPDHTLQPTPLVHEAYAKPVGPAGELSGEARW